jgi:hypothetical protein
MRVSVLTLCRDRVEYTQKCFELLRANAGIDYSHFVLDQGSQDGTWSYLLGIPLERRIRLAENIGLCPALNRLIEEGAAENYDAVVRFDNDCEVLQPGTLRTVAELAVKHNLILAPRVLGLQNPPPTIAEFTVDGYTVLETTILGGVFMAVPGVLFTRDGYRYDENNPPWAGDELICEWFRDRGGRCGYVKEFAVNHLETTSGQLARYPTYFARRAAERRLYESSNKAIRRKNAVKRALLSVPFVDGLNRHYSWFSPPGAEWSSLEQGGEQSQP